MRFPGFWVDGIGADVCVKPDVFDETEVSPESGWKRAYQNEDANGPSGFVDPLGMHQDVPCRVAARNVTDCDELKLEHQPGQTLEIRTARAFACLIPAASSEPDARVAEDQD